MRACILCVGALSTLIAIVVHSIYALFVLCGDLVYVMVFPQLVGVIHFPRVNSYGAVLGYVVSAFLRMTGGEPLVGLPPLIRYPYYNEETGVQYFPYKTLVMLIAFLVILTASYSAEFLFTKGHLSLKYDVFKCFTKTEDWTKSVGNASGKRLNDYVDCKGESMDLLNQKTSSI